MTSSEDSGEVLPLTESAKCNLSAAEAYEYLTKAGNVYKKLTCLSLNPPVQPRGGSIFLYDSSFAMESCTEDLFPQPGNQVGYCGAEFHSEPPKDSLHGLTNRLQLDTNQRISFYECRGKPLIISAAFVNSKP